jgi:hypothetical protein
MDVVGDATYSDRVSTYILYDATDVREDPSEVFLSDGDSSALDVEHDVDV